YSALQQNTYDAMDNPINLIDQMKFYEVQDYLTISDHAYTATVAFMNDDFFNDLPEDIQEAVQEALDESMDYQREEAREQDKEEFIEAAEPIFDKYEEEIGSDLMEKARSYRE